MGFTVYMYRIYAIREGQWMHRKKKRKGMDAEMENVSDVWGMKK